jgi:hypothetical protein
MDTAQSSPDGEAFTDIELLAFLDEQLGPERSSAIESAVRQIPKLHQRLIHLRGQNVAGLHTIGSIWRRERLSCPDRETLQRFLLKELDVDVSDYIRFHLHEIGCRVCMANYDDLNQAIHIENEAVTRRRRLFQTSAGHLR